MSKRFYPTSDFVHAKRPYKRKRWPLILLGVAGGVFVFWIVGEYDWHEAGKTAMNAERESIASTSTNAELRDEVSIDPEQYVISTSVDTVAEAPQTVDKESAPDSANPKVIAEEKTAARPRVALPSVTLFNGCGVKGVGARAKAALEAMGFSVVEVRNAMNFDYATSEILDRRENLNAGRLLADSLGIKPSLAAWDTTRSDKDADVSLIVGADYKKLRWKL